MIFVTVGTTKFEALVKKIDEIATELNEKIIMQIGKGKYIPKNCEYFTFKKEISEYQQKADLIITHGGAGTLFELLTLKNKRIIGVNNTQLIDEHQSDLLKKLAAEKHIIWCSNLNTIKKDVLKSRTFKFKKYDSPECDIDKYILKTYQNKK